MRWKKATAKAGVEERPRTREKASHCHVCEGTGHPARWCSRERWVIDVEEDAPEGEDTNEDGCWTEEDTLQLEYLGSDSCLISSPPRLRDAVSEAGWTVVTRKLRNRQQCSWVL